VLAAGTTCAFFEPVKAEKIINRKIINYGNDSIIF
jgi:hypothetical protein